MRGQAEKELRKRRRQSELDQKVFGRKGNKEKKTQVQDKGVEWEGRGGVLEYFMRNEDLWPSEGVRSQDLYFFGWRDHWRYKTWWTFAGRGKKENPIQFLSSTARIRKFQFRTESYLLPCMSCLTSWEKSYLSPNSSPSLVTSSLLPVLFPQHHPSCPLFSFVICFLSWA